jgi:hypothetical protein
MIDMSWYSILVTIRTLDNDQSVMGLLHVDQSPVHDGVMDVHLLFLDHHIHDFKIETKIDS